MSVSDEAEPGFVFQGSALALPYLAVLVAQWLLIAVDVESTIQGLLHLHPCAHRFLDLWLVLERISHVAPSGHSSIKRLVLVASSSDQFRTVQLVLRVGYRTEFRYSSLGSIMTRVLSMVVFETQEILI